MIMRHVLPLIALALVVRADAQTARFPYEGAAAAAAAAQAARSANQARLQEELQRQRADEDLLRNVRTMAEFRAASELARQRALGRLYDERRSLHPRRDRARIAQLEERIIQVADPTRAYYPAIGPSLRERFPRAQLEDGHSPTALLRAWPLENGGTLEGVLLLYDPPRVIVWTPTEPRKIVSLWRLSAAARTAIRAEVGQAEKNFSRPKPNSP